MHSKHLKYFYKQYKNINILNQNIHIIFFTIGYTDTRFTIHKLKIIILIPIWHEKFVYLIQQFNKIVNVLIKINNNIL